MTLISNLPEQTILKSTLTEKMIGQKQRSSTMRPTSNECKCNFRFNVFSNDHCFFLDVNDVSYHNGHLAINERELALKKPRLSGRVEVDWIAMAAANNAGSSTAIGLVKLNGIPCTHQHMKNRSMHHPSNAKSPYKNSDLSSCNDAETIRSHLLKSYSCRVMILRAKQDTVKVRDSLECEEPPLMSQPMQ